MDSRICMNASCGTAMTHEWKRGWPLRSGGYADLCYNCGSAYENLVFCDQFHLDEPGWRECYLCRKRLHCGCIASKSLVELLDYGGVGCTNCVMSARLHKIQRDEIRGVTVNNANDHLPTAAEIRVVNNGADEQKKLTDLCRVIDTNETNSLRTPLSQINDTNISVGKDKRDDIIRPFVDISAVFSSPTPPVEESSKFTKQESSRSMLDFVDVPEPLSQPSLSMSLGVPSRSSNIVLPFSNGDGSKQNKGVSPFQQGHTSRPILPKPPKSGLNIGSESKGLSPQLRIARQPIDGRGKNHLLPRYWPRITEQELQQLSGDLNSTVVPLFEKVLSASDAGRIGRLVLPKACAEAYFPPISQSEGLPIRIQDVKGKEWVFQFRFWPNNNSRMYVLEGVTPCIQSMQLRAGDTIIFSRIDPGGKLMMGFRKAANSEDAQDAQTSALPNGESSSGITENLPSISGYSGHFQTLKGSKEPYMSALSENCSLPEVEVGWRKSENHGGRMNEDSPQSVPMLEKKRTRNIGSKSKRLLMHSEDVMELRVSWEESQDLLRPPPKAKPSTVEVDGYEFEEYDEPPVFGKKTIFLARSSGGQEQWGQCDDCSKWRKLPIDVFLPSRWTCFDNVWDPARRSCSAPMEMSQKEVENLLRVSRDSRKRKAAENQSKVGEESEPSGLDALASAAVLGENGGDSGENSSGATTKHPRHRPGCSCIVCIQPPSGKGKHRAGCTCNVCLTVKRRFKTLMMRKKRRQVGPGEAVADPAQKEEEHQNGEAKLNGCMTRHNHDLMVQQMNQRVQAELGAETGSGQIDLNFHPNREDVPVEDQGSNGMGFVETASLPLESFNVNSMQQQQQQRRLGNGVSSLSQSPSSCLQQQVGANGEREKLVSGEGLFSVPWLQDQDHNSD